MQDWVAPIVVCVLVVAMLIVAEIAGRVGGGDATPDSKPKEKAKADRADAPAVEKAPDSIQSMTVEAKPKPAPLDLPKLDSEEDEDVDPTRVGIPAGTAKVVIHPPTKKIVYDEDAATEEPTRPGELILISATAQTDKGVRRKKNEDSLLVMKEEGIYVVADGMGGYSGGEIASELAVKTIQKVFDEKDVVAEAHEGIPRRASELAQAIQSANEAILARASTDKRLEGMGTTICAARFSRNKQRLYVAHVGDSRMYRMRNGDLRQMTSDHTMRDFGMTGPGSDHLSRAVGVWPTVPVDILLAMPLPGDTYLLCSDGLTKMVDDARIAEVLAKGEAPEKVAEELVREANARGGKDNITAILVHVQAPPNSHRPT